MICFKNLSTLVLLCVFHVSGTSTSSALHSSRFIQSTTESPQTDSPSYRYSYEITNRKEGTSSGNYGKLEARDGALSQGQYYVNLPENGAQSEVQYFTDEWGYHPLFQYSTTNAHSKVSAQFALGEQAVQALKNKQEHETEVTPSPNTLQYSIAPSPQPIVQQYVVQQNPGSVVFPLTYTNPIRNNPIFKTEKVQPIYQHEPAEVLIDQQRSLKENLSYATPLRKGHQNVFIAQHDDPNTIDQNYINLGSYNIENNPSIKNESFNSLIQNTQNLISALDVLNINRAVESHTENETLNKVTPQQFDNSPYTGGRLAQPIVVTDFGGGVTEGYPVDSSTPLYDNKIDYFSTTQNTVETEVSTLQSGPPTEPGTVNGLHPIGQEFLAPITAALRIKNAGERIENLFTADCDNNINALKHSSGSTDFEIQKSIPFYIGKFEYYDTSGRLEPISHSVISAEYGKVENNNAPSYEPLKMDNGVEETQSSENRNQNVYVANTEKVVEKTQYVDKLVPVPVPVPVTKIIEKPYPIEKIVEKPVHIPVEVEKIVEKPIPKIIEKPYHIHVQVPIPQPVPVPIEVPQPYPIEVTKVIEKPVPQPFAIPVPQPYAVPVTKLVSVPVEIPKYVDRPVPIKHFIDRPYPIYIPVVKDKHRHLHNEKQNHLFAYAPSYHMGVPKNNYYKNYHDDYIGPVPLRHHIGYNIFYTQKPRRNASPKPNRHNFGKNLKIEYGFKPPMIPSIETDEFGIPLQKDKSN